MWLELAHWDTVREGFAGILDDDRMRMAYQAADEIVTTRKIVEFASVDQRPT